MNKSLYSFLSLVISFKGFEALTNIPHMAFVSSTDVGVNIRKPNFLGILVRIVAGGNGIGLAGLVFGPPAWPKQAASPVDHFDH
jgi:hypothetical protein